MNAHVRDNLSFLYTPPMVRVYNSATITGIVTVTGTLLTYDSERFDTDTCHSTSSNTGRITATTAGKYLLGSQVTWEASSAGTYRDVYLQLGGATILVLNSQTPSGGNTVRQQAVTLYALAATNYVETWVGHDKGSNSSITAAGNYTPEFWAMWQSG